MDFRADDSPGFRPAPRQRIAAASFVCHGNTGLAAALGAAAALEQSFTGARIMANRDRMMKVLLAVAGVFTCTASAFAGGGNVLPASANPKGYSLNQMAAATAVYNTGQATGNPLTPPPPDVPFHVLVADATVKHGTMLYLPIFYADDSGGAPSDFPDDITDQDDCADYLDDLVLNGFGVEAFIVQVDGQTTVLDDDYVTGTATAPLLDGTPAGTNYITSAVFLTPLTRGVHTVSIGGIIDGEAIPFVAMTVTVR
jgi:hypothetical protein